MDTALALFMLLTFVVGGVAGILIGRGYERYRIYANLLHSRDPESWTAAHRIRVGDAARYPVEERSEGYNPTPSQPFPALQPQEEPFPPGDVNPMAEAPTNIMPQPPARWVVPKPPSR